MVNEPWWKQAVIYQIYPRSFYDSNGDGIGDLKGITEKLDYLQQLGIQALWLSPVCCSPQDDNGYDISDYQDIDPLFGSLDDMDELIGQASMRGIRIIMDLVLNHTSDEHPWFLEAKKSRNNPYHDFYVWREGTEGTPPNDLKASFGGSAWEWVPQCGQYYLHQFSVKQPDLNWENPQVRKEIYKMIRWWTERGIGGFRLDVIDLVAKEPDRGVMAEGRHLHEYLKEMSREVFQGRDLITVGEAWSATPERAFLYSNPDQSELSMVFQFEHIVLDQQPGGEKWDLAPLPFVTFKKTLAKWQTQLYGKGWNSLFFSNHDLPRSVSRFGNDGEYREKSAKMLALCLHGMQGTPYVYQGEELGMTNVRYEISEYRDIELLNMYRERKEAGCPEKEIMESVYAKGRDNARTPMQWNDGVNAGFTSGMPWIRVNPNYTKINAEQEIADENSVFHFYRKLIGLRKQERVLIDGRFELLLPEHDSLFAYTRENEDCVLLVICNFASAAVSYDLPGNWEDGEVLLSNGKQKFSQGILEPYDAYMVIRRKEDVQ